MSAGLAAEFTRSIHIVQFAAPANFQKVHANLLVSGFLEHPLSNEIKVVLLSLNSTTLEFSISFRNSAITDTTASVFNNLNLAVPLYRILSLVRHSTQQLGIPQMNHLGPKTHLCI